MDRPGLDLGLPGLGNEINYRVEIGAGAGAVATWPSFAGCKNQLAGLIHFYGSRAWEDLEKKSDRKIQSYCC